MAKFFTVVFASLFSWILLVMAVFLTWVVSSMVLNAC